MNNETEQKQPEKGAQGAECENPTLTFEKAIELFPKEQQNLAKELNGILMRFINYYTSLTNTNTDKYERLGKELSEFEFRMKNDREASQCIFYMFLIGDSKYQDEWKRLIEKRLFDTPDKKIETGIRNLDKLISSQLD